jgi:hypothetical protein
MSCFTVALLFYFGERGHFIDAIFADGFIKINFFHLVGQIFPCNRLIVNS